MRPSVLIFDLDGTLSDPIEGIANSINHALTAHGFAQASSGDISKFIGPPIDHIFREFTQSSDYSIIEECISTYRERYSETGYAENRKYDGIDEVLTRLSQAGCKMGVCTSKRVDFSRKIVTLFGWDHHFDFISGGDVGISKAKQLADLLASG